MDQPPVVLVHGGPGLPDYLEPVSTLIDDMTQVHRYDQRGTGGSRWDGLHTMARHVQDLGHLIDAWGHDRVVLVGHSYGTDLTSFFVRAHPERVAGVVYLCGPFVGPWRGPTRTAERARRSDSQQARLEQLDALSSRTDEEEVEYLALSWFTDHADQDHAWEWATASARRLRQLALELACDVTIIPGAGHHPWMERREEFGAALRGALSRQVDRSARRYRRR